MFAPKRVRFATPYFTIIQNDDLPFRAVHRKSQTSLSKQPVNRNDGLYLWIRHCLTSALIMYESVLSDFETSLTNVMVPQKVF